MNTRSITFPKTLLDGGQGAIPAAIGAQTSIFTLYFR